MIKLCLLTTFLAIMLSCATNKPTLLFSPSQSKWQPTVNPSPCVPEKGVHPYLGLSAGMGQPDVFDNSYRNFNFGLNGGLLLQPSLENDWKAGLFSSLSASLVFSSFTFSPNIDSRQLMTEEKESTLSSKYNSITSDLCLRGGLLVNLNIGTLSLYTHGFSQYENGEYFKLRREIDNIGNYYNLSTERSSFGLGMGVDISFKQKNHANAGIIFESNYVYVEAQTFDSSYIDDDKGLFGTYIVVKDSDGKEIVLGNKKVEVYFEQKRIRLSFCFTDYDSTMIWIYKW